MWFILIAKQDVIDSCDIGAGYLVISVLVAIDEGAVLVVEQPVVERSDIGAGHIAVAVHVAWD